LTRSIAKMPLVSARSCDILWETVKWLRTLLKKLLRQFGIGQGVLIPIEEAFAPTFMELDGSAQRNGGAVNVPAKSIKRSFRWFPRRKFNPCGRLFSYFRASKGRSYGCERLMANRTANSLPYSKSQSEP